MKALGSEQSAELIWCLVPRSVIYLPRRVSGKESTYQPGHPARLGQQLGRVLLPAGTTTPHAQASWSLSLFPGATWSPASPSTVCAGNQQVLTGAVLLHLQFQAAVAQE